MKNEHNFREAAFPKLYNVLHLVLEACIYWAESSAIYTHLTDLMFQTLLILVLALFFNGKFLEHGIEAQ